MFFNFFNDSIRCWEVRIKSVAHAVVEEPGEILEISKVVEAEGRRLKTPVNITLFRSSSSTIRKIPPRQ